MKLARLLDTLSTAGIARMVKPEPGWHLSVYADPSMTEAEFDALFDRVAEAAHALDEPVTCYSSHVAAPSLKEATG